MSGAVIDTKETKIKGATTSLASAPVQFKHKAKEKITALIEACDTECEWFGLIKKERSEQDAQVSYIVEDILVPPQYVASSHVEDADEEYSKWICEMWCKDGVFETMKMYGHSHVNFPPNPSGTDMKFQRDRIKEMGGQGFYMFLIVNKRSEWWCSIVDFEDDEQESTAGRGFDDVLVGTEHLEDEEKETFIAESKAVMRPITEMYKKQGKPYKEIKEEAFNGLEKDNGCV